jgi:L-alanine-DL-glutamate epimerase-like enolase superfamily enzyme
LASNHPRLSWESLTLKLQNPFRVAYGTSDTRQAFWLRLAGDAGWGEGTIPPYYGVETEAMATFWQTAAQRQDPFPDDPDAIGSWVGDQGPAPARAALDLALHDRIGRLAGKPLYKLLNLPKPTPLPTSYTIGIDTPQAMAQVAAQIPDFPIIKVKLGSDDDLARLDAIREARPDARLCVDANAAWSTDEALEITKALADYALDFIEQPVARDNFEGMGLVQAACDVPVVADESVQTAQDLERLAAAGVQGINLKLMKVGGLAPALALIKRAQALGLRIMLGCMIETSLGVTAMTHLSGLADWLDLDAPLLIANDPFEGVRFDKQARIHVPNHPGIGIRLRK